MRGVPVALSFCVFFPRGKRRCFRSQRQRSAILWQREKGETGLESCLRDARGYSASSKADPNQVLLGEANRDASECADGGSEGRKSKRLGERGRTWRDLVERDQVKRSLPAE